MGIGDIIVVVFGDEFFMCEVFLLVCVVECFGEVLVGVVVV